MAEIIRPDVIWIEGRCYRINDASTEMGSFKEHDFYENGLLEDTYISRLILSRAAVEELARSWQLPSHEFLYKDVENDEDDNDEFDVSQISNERFKTTFHVSKHYLGSVIGKKGITKGRIERDTRTEIKIPRQGHDGDIVILGPSEANVKAARRRINIIVMSSRFKQKSTHFISIPMNAPSVIEAFNKFKEDVLKNSSDRGLEESLFIRPWKLHLTLGVMCLMDNEERIFASKLLTETRDKIVLPMLQNYQPLKIRLKGLQYMNDDPKEIDVLYGLVKEENAPSGILQRLSDEIVEYFSRAGFMQREHDRDNVKLHVTLINSKYRSRSKKEDEHNSEHKKTRETFDGSRILERFGDYDFGIVDLASIHLSQRHSMGPDGYYQPTCVISCV